MWHICDPRYQQQAFGSGVKFQEIGLLMQATGAARSGMSRHEGLRIPLPVGAACRLHLETTGKHDKSERSASDDAKGTKKLQTESERQQTPPTQHVPHKKARAELQETHSGSFKHTQRGGWHRL